MPRATLIPVEFHDEGLPIQAGAGLGKPESPESRENKGPADGSAGPPR